MDWQLIEIGLVTVLALWVYLFSPSDISRLVATVVFLVNLAWVLLERQPAQRHSRTTPGARTRLQNTAAGPADDSAGTHEPQPDSPEQPRII